MNIIQQKIEESEDKKQSLSDLLETIKGEIEKMYLEYGDPNLQEDLTDKLLIAGARSATQKVLDLLTN